MNFFADNLPGDKASDSYSTLWVTEILVEGEYVPAGNIGFATREAARQEARYWRLCQGAKTRVTPYKACIDTKGRHNRQITSERLDA